MPSAIRSGLAVTVVLALGLGVVLSRTGAISPLSEGVRALPAAAAVVWCAIHLMEAGKTMVVFAIQLGEYALHEFTESSLVPGIDNACWHAGAEDLAKGLAAQMILLALVSMPTVWRVGNGVLARLQGWRQQDWFNI